MGLFDRFKRVQAVDTFSWSDTSNSYYGAWQMQREEYERILGMTPGDMWRTQPYLRTVVSFLARNIAQLGLQGFDRVEDTDRQRVHDGVADVFRRPNAWTTCSELVYGLVSDLALYDSAYWLMTDDPEQRLTRLPVPWVFPKGGDLYQPDHYEVRLNDRGESAVIPTDQVLAFHGWHPGNLRTGSSPVHALREILAEQVQAARYRQAVWARGGKVGAVITRPPEAPDWSDAARTQFKSDWQSRYTGNGPGVGGTPILEDGMTINRVDFSAHEMEWVDGSRLALNTVASVYHVNPTMIGLLDNANYSNVREFRRMLYGDTLGPIIAMIEDRLNTFYVPLVDDRPNVYVEFNIDEKLQGSFEEQTAALQSSVGRPWMTANEARALRNMPAIETGDELVTPLNVLLGSPPPPVVAPEETPTDQPPVAPKARLVSLKGRPSQPQVDKINQVLASFFGRQSRAVLSAIGAGDDDWWDQHRWDTELASDLHKTSLAITSIIGKDQARALGFSEDDYAPEATVNYLEEVAKGWASGINATTHDHLKAAIEDPDQEPADAFQTARTRASGIAVGLGTTLAGFASSEAASQLARTHNVEPTKTWVTGPNARPEHEALDGETVGINDSFSNGLAWPGAMGADAAQTANCNCSVLINL